ncbi:hypothetical protein G6F57_021556 [Rhizopus arrhizus]|nr:hypothetical protein G6F57_021556 [Rhizopus arrhizus]
MARRGRYGSAGRRRVRCAPRSARGTSADKPRSGRRSPARCAARPRPGNTGPGIPEGCRSCRRRAGHRCRARAAPRHCVAPAGRAARVPASLPDAGAVPPWAMC